MALTADASVVNPLEPDPNAHVSQARHEARCSICCHPQRRAIEKAFLRRELTVSGITKRYGVGHDATYRHARAMNMLPTRNRNWRAPLEPDNGRAAETAILEEQKTVLHAEVRSTPHARAILELLKIPAPDVVLTAVEGAIEAKAAKENVGVDEAANVIFITAALVKIAKAPESWLRWFQQVAGLGEGRG